MYKSKLQEYCQRNRLELPEYTTLKDGPIHNPRFSGRVMVDGTSFEAPTQCRSSKEAQNLAAEVALNHFMRPAQPNTVSAVHSPQVPPVASRPPPAAPAVPFPSAASSSALPGEGIIEPRQEGKTQTSLISKTVAGYSDICKGSSVSSSELLSEEIIEPREEDKSQTSFVCKSSGSSDVSKGMLHSYKNRLQQYAQKHHLTSPVYSHKIEGPPHAPRFRSKVEFNGKTYECLEFFHTLKEAEHSAAKVAFDSLVPDEFHEDNSLYKTLLQELAQKKDILFPSYNTVSAGPAHSPVFMSTVEIGNGTFQGREAKTKKQAEMNAAKVAYEALTENLPSENDLGVVSASLGSTDAGNAKPNIEPTAKPIVKNIQDREHRGSRAKDALRIASANMDSLIPLVAADITQKLESTGKSTLRDEPHAVAKGTDMRSESANLTPDKVSAKLPTSVPPASSAEGVSTTSEHLTISDSISTTEEVKKRRCKTVAFSRNSNMPIPKGATVLYSDETAVAYRTEQNN